MNLTQNRKLLQNLYRLKALGFNYTDPLILETTITQTSFKTLQELHSSVLTCHLCDLSKSRKTPMGGYGNPNASLMIVDYEVSIVEDSTGSFYSGKSGEMLKNMVEKVLGFRVEDIYITHAIKCKSLEQKEPTSTQWDSCKNYLFAQIELIKPKVIVALGKSSYAKLMGEDSDFEQVRGSFIEYKNYKLIPLFHPSYLLRNPKDKKIAMQDLQTIKGYL
ncbi:MAG: uracil-DNA glycosylase [Sulfurimonas sp.]|jgi:DNA polymerase|nr:uracil-DNA glycosylase [Sulfurimonadaceae bacterium]